MDDFQKQSNDKDWLDDRTYWHELYRRRKRKWLTIPGAASIKKMWRRIARKRLKNDEGKGRFFKNYD